MFPAEIRSSDAPTDDFRYTRSCNSVTIEFETTESHSNVNLVYRRMGGERDIILFDGVEIGSAGPQGRDPFQSTEYLVPVGDLEAGTHTIQIIGQERPECTSGGRCIEGKADGYHWVDGLLLSGETE
jgi:hypothetical protein